MSRTAAKALLSRKTRLAGAALALLTLGACGIRPDPISAGEHSDRAQADHEQLAKRYVPLTGPLTQSEAIARALKYNYDVMQSRLEQTLQEREIDLALMQMMPKLAADAGYSMRSNNNSATSISERTRIQSLEPSYSTSRRHFNADLVFSWNMLDIGVSYFQARQQGYRALVAVERRRKVIEGIVKGVQSAYRQAAIADRLLPKLEPLLRDAERILEASRKTTRARLQPEAQSLDYQENLLRVISQLRHMRTDLMTSKSRLAALIAVPPDAPLRVVQPREFQLRKPTNVDMERLELTALNQRPEVREAAYQEKIDRQDIYKEILKMMPGVGVLGSLNYDSDRLLYNHTWADLGFRASYNLISLIQGPQAISTAKAAVEVAKARRMAMGVAVLTQIHIGYREYVAALDDLATATEVNRIEQAIARASSHVSQADAQPATQRVRRDLAAMLAEYDRARAAADAYTALANLYTATGNDLVPPSVELGELPKLAQDVDAAIATFNAGQLPPVNLPPPPAPTAEAPAQGGINLAALPGPRAR